LLTEPLRRTVEAAKERVRLKKRSRPLSLTAAGGDEAAAAAVAATPVGRVAARQV
jgi:hypothetical protein